MILCNIQPPCDTSGFSVIYQTVYWYHIVTTIINHVFSTPAGSMLCNRSLPGIDPHIHYININTLYRSREC